MMIKSTTKIIKKPKSSPKDHSFKLSTKGSFIPSVMVFAVVGVIIVGTLVTYSLFQLRNGEYLANRTASFQIAEAGIQYYAWYLKHTPQTGTEKFSDGNITKSDTDSSAIITNGSEFNGPYTHQYANADGQTVGTYEIYIKAPNPNDPAITVKSIGKSLNSSIKRTIIARMEEEPLMEYTVLADQAYWNFSNIAPTIGNYSGKIHSNSELFWQGTLKDDNSAVYSGKEIYNSRISWWGGERMTPQDTQFHEFSPLIDFSYIYSRYFDKMREESSKEGNHYLKALTDKPKYYVYVLYLTGNKVKEYILPLKVTPDTYFDSDRRSFLFFIDDLIITEFNQCNQIDYETAKARAVRKWGPTILEEGLYSVGYNAESCIDSHLESSYIDLNDLNSPSYYIDTFDITNNLIFTDAPTAVIGDPNNPLDGKLTITSTRPILLQNDIQYKRDPATGTRDENTGLVLATKDRIKITHRSSYDLNLDGYFIALYKRDGANISNPSIRQFINKLPKIIWGDYVSANQPQTPVSCAGPYVCLGKFNVFGGITSSSRWAPGYGWNNIIDQENVGSYQTINMDPDLNLIRNSPLYAPSTGKIKTVSWEVVEDD